MITVCGGEAISMLNVGLTALVCDGEAVSTEGCTALVCDGEAVLTEGCAAFKISIVGC